MPLISNLAVTFIEQGREMLNYQSDVPVTEAAHALYRRLRPGVSVRLSTLPSKSQCIVKGTIRNEEVQHNSLGEISEVTERFYIFLYNKTNRRTNFPILFWLKMNLYMFRTVPLPIIRPALLVSWLQTVWHIPGRSVQLSNSWWWAEKLPETCRGSFFSQNKFGKLVRLLVLLRKKKFVTMHGHMNVKFVFTFAKKVQSTVCVCVCVRAFSKGSAWMYVLFYDMFNDAVSSIEWYVEGWWLLFVPPGWTLESLQAKWLSGKAGIEWCTFR